MTRHGGLKAGLPIETPAVTVNRLCGSGFEAITQGAQLILLGETDVVLAGGAESMSQAPHVVRGARWGLRLGPAPLEDLLWESLKDPQCGLSMAETAEHLAEKYKLTRAAVDEVALGSQQRAKKAWDDCVFQDEVIAVPVKKKGQAVDFRADEHMRPDTTLAGLAALKPYFKKDGLVTAGNASGISDGAAATIIAGEDFVKAHGVKPLGRLVAWAVVGIVMATIAGVVLYLFSGLRVLGEYEGGVYFFLGRSWGAKGPGLIYLPPLFAKMQKVSLRVVAMDIPPQDVITRDNISIKVNAVLYMRVMDSVKAVIGVEN